MFSDNEDKMVELLQEIRDEVGGGSGSSTVRKSSETVNVDRTTNRTVNIDKAPKRINKPHNAINLTNQVWEDDRISAIELDGDLGPGDTETLARIQSNQSDVTVAVSAVAATEHTADLDGDADEESIVEYYWEFQTQGGGDAWNPLPGLSSTLPLGYLGSPVEVVPGELVGPISGFRCRMHNRSDTAANPQTVPAEDLGGQLAGIILREEDS